MTSACRNCQHYDLAAVKDARGRVLTRRTARCLFPVATIKLPASTHRHSKTISLTRMSPDDGADCPVFAPAPKERRRRVIPHPTRSAQEVKD